MGSGSFWMLIPVWTPASARWASLWRPLSGTFFLIRSHRVRRWRGGLSFSLQVAGAGRRRNGETSAHRKGIHVHILLLTLGEPLILVSKVLPGPRFVYSTCGWELDHGLNVLFPDLACRVPRVVAIALREAFTNRHQPRADADSEGFQKLLVCLVQRSSMVCSMRAAGCGRRTSTSWSAELRGAFFRRLCESRLHSRVCIFQIRLCLEGEACPLRAGLRFQLQGALYPARHWTLMDLEPADGRSRGCPNVGVHNSFLLEPCSGHTPTHDGCLTGFWLAPARGKDVRSFFRLARGLVVRD